MDECIISGKDRYDLEVNMEKLELGVAYHGNRMLQHVKDDMRDIVAHNMNLVVHMFTHNDMGRHKNVMKDIFDVTRDAGLDFWVDNWGLAGKPGDPSHFLGYSPDSHRVLSDGTVDPVGVCFASEKFIEFTKQWIDMVGEVGGRKLFWDEPHYVTKADGTYACCCDRCKKRFREKYGYEMPKTVNADVEQHRIDVMSDYFREITDYSHKYGMTNYACLMPTSLAFMDALLDLPHIENIGIDPYWYVFKEEAYPYVYDKTKQFIDATKAKNKTTHAWIQTYEVPAGREDEIYLATDAAYDSGARSILAWSYRGGEACDYRADNCELVWQITGDAMRRVKDRFLDEQRAMYLNKKEK